jgi:hypothetical protein
VITSRTSGFELHSAAGYHKAGVGAGVCARGEGAEGLESPHEDEEQKEDDDTSRESQDNGSLPPRIAGTQR